MKLLPFFIVFFLLTNGLIAQSTKIDSLILLKSNIDTFRLKNKNRTEVFVKIENKEGLIKIENQNWPKDIETTFNIVKNNENKIILVGQYPYSQSGDWTIEFLHYFDKNGRTIATKKETRFFNGLCIDGVLIEVIEKYFSDDFKIISETYDLKDKDGNNMKNKDCINQYNIEFQIEQNSVDLFKSINYSW